MLRLGALFLILCGAAAAQNAPTIIASKEGSFAGAAGLSVEANTDRVAALEQQAFREFRWDVLASAFLDLRFDTTAPETTTARIVISADGENFLPLSPNTLANEGQVIAVLIAQQAQDSDAGLSFPAAEWSFDLSARPTPPLEGDTVGGILLPIEFGDDLGCDTPGCGEEVADGASLPVSGEPRSEAGPSGPDPASSEERELARELQSELARVGCYAIAIDGLWGPGSRAAMGAFNAAKGVELPVQSPTAKALVAVARETETICSE